jgi:hypothetical protein
MKKKIYYSLMVFVLIIIIILFQCCEKETGQLIVKPEIFLYGNNPDTVVQFDTTPYVDPGAYALDEYGNLLTITTNGTIDNNNAGEYIIRFLTSDETGNSSTMERTVIVDGAKYLAGNYIAEDFTDSTSNGTYNEIIKTTIVSDNKVIFDNFANINNASVYGFTLYKTITIPEQTLYCGNPPATRIFNGIGTYTNSSNSFTIYYAETTDTIIRAGHCTLTRQ